MKLSHLIVAVAALAGASDHANGQFRIYSPAGQPRGGELGDTRYASPYHAPSLYESLSPLQPMPTSVSSTPLRALARQSESGCGECGKCSRGIRNANWHASFTALYMCRNDANRLWTTYETGNNPNQLTNTKDADAHWRGGIEVSLGRVICDSCWSWKANYWTLDSMKGFENQTHASTVSTPLDVAGIEFSGVNGTALFDGAAEHRLWRTNDVHNFELNLFHEHLACGCDGGFSLSSLVGFRYFRFEEDLCFGSLDSGGSWGSNGGLDEAYFDEHVENDMFGFQFGFDARWFTRSRVSFYLTPKFGIYNNHISHRFHAYRGDGTAATPTAASGVTGSYPVAASKDVVSFMTEVDLGIRYNITSRCDLALGYRVVAVTGVGLADNQIPPYIVDIPELADIDVNGNLVLHGAVAGFTYWF